MLVLFSKLAELFIHLLLTIPLFLLCFLPSFSPLLPLSFLFPLPFPIVFFFPVRLSTVYVSQVGLKLAPPALDSQALSAELSVLLNRADSERPTDGQERGC